MNFSELEKIINDGKQKFKAFESADEALSKIKGMVQLENETKAALQSTIAELDKAKKELENWKDKLKDAENNAFEKVANAEKSAKAIIERAESGASDILKKAEMDAKQYLQSSVKQKEELLNLVEANKSKALDWEAKAQAAKAAHDAYKAAIVGS